MKKCIYIWFQAHSVKKAVRICIICCWPACSFWNSKYFDSCCERMNFHLFPSLLCEQARRSSAKWAQLSHGCCCYTAHYGPPGRAAGWCVFWDGRYWLAGLMPYTIGLHSRPVFTSRPTTKLGPSHFFFGFSGLLDTSDHNCGTSAVNKHWRRVAIKKKKSISFFHLLLSKISLPCW